MTATVGITQGHFIVLMSFTFHACNHIWTALRYGTQFIFISKICFSVVSTSICGAPKLNNIQVLHLLDLQDRVYYSEFELYLTIQNQGLCGD